HPGIGAPARGLPGAPGGVTDVLERLAERALGAPARVRPVLGSRFEPRWVTAQPDDDPPATATARPPTPARAGPGRSPPQPPATPAPPPEPAPPAVEVTIGRLEVRAVVPTPPPAARVPADPPRAARPEPRLDLDAFLRREQERTS